METRKQGLPLVTAIVTLIATLVVIQLWLLAATIESLLGSGPSIAVAAAVAQAVLFALNGVLLLYVFAFDRSLRKEARG